MDKRRLKAWHLRLFVVSGCQFHGYGVASRFRKKNRVWLGCYSQCSSRSLRRVDRVVFGGRNRRVPPELFQRRWERSKTQVTE